MASTAAAAADVASSSSVNEEELKLTVKWSGKEYTVRVCGDDSVGELKRRICQVTNVLPKRQKLLYPKLSGPKLSDDSILLSQLPLKSSFKMTMIGECGIWAVRNLLEGNEENQKVIAELEIQVSVDVYALAELGFRMELDPYTRRARLVNISPR